MTESITLNHRLCVYLWRKRRIFVSKSNKHNNGAIYIQFFGFYFLFAKTPEKKIFKNYLRSRQIMGIAMLLLSANYSVHFFFGIRLKNADSSILMNMSTYFLCYSLFSSALIMLLDRFYITKRRVWTHIILWIIFSTLSGVVVFLVLPSGIMQKFSLFALAVWLVVFGVVLARRVIVAYRRAIRIFNETQADDIGAYIEWLSIFTYWAVIFGVGCGLLTFLPDKYVFIWILSSIPFYSYLFYSYQNYLLFYEQVENAFEQDIQSEEELLTTRNGFRRGNSSVLYRNYREGGQLDKDRRLCPAGTYHKRTVRNTSYEPYLSFRLYQDYV